MDTKTNEENKKTLEVIRSNEDVLNRCRYIMLYGVINDKKAEEINTKLVAMHLLDKKAQIMLHINSGGGCCTSGLSIIDTMLGIGNPIITYISGRACSMATYIAVVGDKRIMSTNAYWMAHPLASWEGDYLEYMKDSMEWLDRLDKRMDGIYKKHTKLTKKDFNKFKHGELWLSSTQCKKKGIVDIIG